MMAIHVAVVGEARREGPACWGGSDRASQPGDSELHPEDQGGVGWFCAWSH